MLNDGIVSVIMGTGNPDYDDDGALRNMPDYSWIAQSEWASLKSGTEAAGFKLIESKADFEALPKTASPPKKLVGIARSLNSTQFNRAGAMPVSETPNAVPRRSDVTSLPTIVLGALNILDDNPQGMFLVIEDGGVDRASTPTIWDD